MLLKYHRDNRLREVQLYQPKKRFVRKIRLYVVCKDVLDGNEHVTQIEHVSDNSLAYVLMYIKLSASLHFYGHYQKF